MGRRKRGGHEGDEGGLWGRMVISGAYSTVALVPTWPRLELQLQQDIEQKQKENWRNYDCHRLSKANQS